MGKILKTRFSQTPITVSLLSQSFLLLETLIFRCLVFASMFLTTSFVLSMLIFLLLEVSILGCLMSSLNHAIKAKLFAFF